MRTRHELFLFFSILCIFLHERNISFSIILSCAFLMETVWLLACRNYSAERKKERLVVKLLATLVKNNHVHIRISKLQEVAVSRAQHISFIWRTSTWCLFCFNSFKDSLSCMCLRGGLYAWVFVPWRPEEGTGSLWAGVTGGWVTPCWW